MQWSIYAVFEQLYTATVSYLYFVNQYIVSAFSVDFQKYVACYYTIHSFISGMHHSDCVVPSVSRVDDSESRQLLHLGRGYWISGPAE